MKTTEIIKRILAHPDCEDVLEILENRLGEESQTPAVANVVQAYLDRDVEAMFAAFTGYDMKEFLAITQIIPDTRNLFGGKKEDALFPDVDSVEAPDVPAPVQIRVFLQDDTIDKVFVQGDTPVEMETVQMHISKYETYEPENAGRLDKLEDYFDATATDPAWSEITPNANDCSDWNLRETKRFHIRKHPGGAWGADMGEYCLLDLKKLTIGVWKDGILERAFDLATAIDDPAIPEGCVAITTPFNTGMGFSSIDAVLSLVDHSILDSRVRTVIVTKHGIPCEVRRVNPIAASNYLVISDSYPSILELARRLDKFVADFDIFDYADCIDSREAHIKMLVHDLGASNPFFITEILKGMISMFAQIEDGSDLKKEAQYLIDQLNALRQYKLKSSGILRRTEAVIAAASDYAPSREQKHDIPNEMAAKFDTGNS